MTPHSPLLAAAKHSAAAAASTWRAEECVTSAASSLLFFTGGALFIATAVFYAISDVMSRKSRLFHYLITPMLGVSSLTYIAQAYGIGVTISEGRCLFGLRYLELMITTPIILSTLGFLAGSPLYEIFLASSASALMLGAQWGGVLLPTRAAAWILWGFSALMWLPQLRTLLRSYVYDARKHTESATLTAGPLTDKLIASVIGLSVIVVGFQLIQHIMYILTATIGKVTGETYIQVMAIVDLLTKVLLSIVLLSQRDMLDWRARAIRSGQLQVEDEGLAGKGTYRSFGETTSITGS